MCWRMVLKLKWLLKLIDDNIFLTKYIQIHFFENYASARQISL